MNLHFNNNDMKNKHVSRLVTNVEQFSPHEESNLRRSVAFQEGNGI